MINLFLLFFSFLAPEKQIGLLLLVSQDAPLKWSPLRSDFGCSRLHELEGLGDINCLLRLGGSRLSKRDLAGDEVARLYLTILIHPGLCQGAAEALRFACH